MCASLSLSLHRARYTTRFARRLFDEHPRARARQVKDCSLPILADLFFIVLVLWGAFFTLNLLLAVLETNFSQGTGSEVITLSVSGVSRGGGAL